MAGTASAEYHFEWDPAKAEANQNPMEIKHIVDPVPFEEGDIPDDLVFDYERSEPNQFADRPGEQSNVVVLDPDVSEVFQTAKSANKDLRAFIEAIPSREAKAA